MPAELLKCTHNPWRQRRDPKERD